MKDITHGHSHGRPVVLNTGRAVMVRRCINPLRSSQNGHQCVDDNFKCIFMNEKYYILIGML